MSLMKKVSCYHDYIKKKDSGFVLLDVLLALFLFTTGFAAVYGLSIGALKEGEEALNLTKAANIAQELMETFASEVCGTGNRIPDGIMQGKKEEYHWQITTEWIIPEKLLQVNVHITWLERGRTQGYKLTSLFAH